MQAGYEVLNPAVSMKSGLEGRNNLHVLPCQ